MLQQTRVEVVKRYFERFLERFPDPAALARASTDEALAAWSGLGYYRRVRQLQAAARALVRDGAAIPRRAAELERLPGVGPYTAAAVASIAFGEAVPVLDGNVERLLARLTREGEPPSRAAPRRRLLAAAARLLDSRRPGDANQAMMELGATICLPRAPRCADCPLAGECDARREGAPEAYPKRQPRRAARRVYEVVAVVERGAEWLLFRRAEEDRELGGLWELPRVEGRRRDVAARRLAARYGGEWRLGELRAEVRHAITDRAFEIAAFDASYAAPTGEVREGPEARWVEPAAAAGLALTGVARKLIERLAG